MKRTLLLSILSLVLTLLIAGCSTSSKYPQLEVNPSTFDFGAINADDGIVSTTLKLKNTGSEILEILGVSTSCGCTSAEVDKETLQPGEETNLKVNFDPNAHEGLTGLLERIVYVRTNIPDKPETQIKIQVEVLEGQ
jgi:hypothetical protein